MDYEERVYKEINNDKLSESIADGSYKGTQNNPVVNSGFGGSQWYEFKDGTVKTYLDLMSENKGKNPLIR